MVLSCEQVRRELSGYVDGLDGGLDAARRAALESHVAGCPRCAALLAGMRNVVQLARDERAFPLPAGFSERLRGRLAARIQPAPDKVQAISGPRAEPSRSGNPLVTSLVWATAAATLFAALSLVRAQYPGAWRPKSRHSQPAFRIPIAQVAIDPEGKLFHVPQCPYLTRKAQIVSCSSAVREGYTPCVRCEGGLLRRKPPEGQEEDSAKLPKGKLAQDRLEISALRRE
ncbi:MAG TPA: zf-HC2 domain-containing protein [Terriglobia bacterium]|nr:zf-HC2 domain-containing protein [Terriglobia bacterium]